MKAGPLISDTRVPQASAADTLPALSGLTLRPLPLARGPHAVIYRGWDRVHHCEVIVKAQRATDDPVAMSRFGREAAVMLRLRHPSIVTLYAFHPGDPQKNDPAALVMEYVPGTTLAALVAADGRLSVAHVVQIMEDIAAALDCVHALGVVHRDVKPSNILLPKHGPAKLTDFGVARIDDDLPLTVMGDILGTIEYASPEQVHGNGTVGARSDVYSLAAVAYFALTATPPFRAADSSTQAQLSVMHRQVFAEPPPLRLHREELSPVIEAAVLRGLAKAPEARYASAGQLAAALRAGLAASLGEPQQPAIDASARRTGAFAGALTGIVLLAGFAFWEMRTVAVRSSQTAAVVLSAVNQKANQKAEQAKNEKRTASAKSFAAKSFAAKSFAAKSFAAKSFTAKSFAAKSFAAKSFTAKSFAAKSFTAKPVPAKLMPVKRVPAKSALVKAASVIPAPKIHNNLSRNQIKDPLAPNNGGTESPHPQPLLRDGRGEPDKKPEGAASSSVQSAQSGASSAPKSSPTSSLAHPLLGAGGHLAIHFQATVPKVKAVPLPHRTVLAAPVPKPRSLALAASKPQAQVRIAAAPVHGAMLLIPPRAAPAPPRAGWYTVSGWIVLPGQASAQKTELVRASSLWIKVDGKPIPALAPGQWAELPAGKHLVTFQPEAGLGVGPKTWAINLAPAAHLSQQVPLPPAPLPDIPTHLRNP